MIEGETYFIRTKHDKVFTGRLTRLTETDVAFTSYCEDIHFYVSNKSTHSMPRDWIVFYFNLAELIVGNRYRFMGIDGETFEGNLQSFSNYHLRLTNYSKHHGGVTTMTIFCVKNIESMM
jgi:hypothetical protein